MGITRTFIDWRQPALPAVARMLAERAGEGQLLDLQGLVLVTPGGRAGRRLLELLAEEAARRRQPFLPPRIVTVGGLPELLYESKRPFAGELTQQLAWARALRELRDEAQPLLRRPPDEGDLPAWLELGALLQAQHVELAADGLDFADVAEQGAAVAGFGEQPRWRFLRRVQQRYLELLDGLGLWDLQTARLYAIDHGLCRTDRELVLVAAADMNRAMRRMLDQVADRVTAVVHAPPALGDRFDQHGCLAAEAWQSAELELADDVLCIVEDAAEQAEEVVRRLAALGGRRRPDEIAIGLADERLAPALERRLAAAGVRTRWVAGRAAGDTAPFRLLAAAADLVETGRPDCFAALVRHPDVGRWLEGRGLRGDWLTELDAFLAERLPSTWDAVRDAEPGAAAAQRAVAEALAPLRGPDRPLHAWPEAVAEAARTFYAQRRLDRRDPRDGQTLEALEAIRAALLELQAVPPELAPRVSGSRAVELVLDEAASAVIPPPADPEAVELLGWLELPLDTAPVLIVTTFNEGFVPTSANSDLFLPNALRRQLGLIDNARRYARDAYAASVLAASREQLTLIAARRDPEGDPLRPSRLALAADAHTAARRALAFFGSGGEEAAGRVWLAADSPPVDRTRLAPPKPRPLKRPILNMSVTSFRDYLACPYRYYLRHVARLQPVDDAAVELDGLQFGLLAHAVLQRFGSSRQRDATDAPAIEAFLHGEMDRIARDQWGRRPAPAVAIQLLQLKERLSAFARWQADWAAAGWRIVRVEAKAPRGAARLPVPGDSRPMTLTGRIDRIDRHKDTGEWVVFDYKTSEKAKSPDQTHREGGRWVDLQLPLYRRFLPSLGVDRSARLGYIVLPRAAEATGERLADWGEQELEEAERTAADVAANVRAQVFWPPAVPPPEHVLDEYGWICQDGVFDPQWELPS